MILSGLLSGAIGGLFGQDGGIPPPPLLDDVLFFLDGASGLSSSAWVDSVHGLTFTGNGTPTIASDSRGRYALLNGSSQYFDITLTSPPSDITIYAVFAPTDTGNPESTHGTILGFRQASNLNNFAYYGGNSGFLTNETYGIGTQFGGSRRIGTSESQLDWAADELLIERLLVGDSEGVTFNVNGTNRTFDLVSGGTAANDFTPAAIITGATNIAVGATLASGGPVLYGKGKLYAVLVYAGLLDAAGLSQVGDYLNARFA